MPETLRLVEASAVGLALAALALALRLGTHLGSRPGGVDTWYFLASAEALRRTRRLPVSLPQYLLQDRTESYPPGFVVLLALLPPAWLRRFFWVVAPAFDALHLLLAYVTTLRLTGSIFAAIAAGAVYALTPQLIAETRSLTPRSLGALLSSVAMFLVLRSLLPEEGAARSLLGPAPWPIAALAVLAIAALFLTHTTSAIAFVVAAAALSAVLGDWRFLGFALAGFTATLLLSGGLYLRVLASDLHAARFWRRNLRYRGAHLLDDSPLYGSARQPARSRNARVAPLLGSLLRLLAENPFLVPMFLVATPALAFDWWGERMYWWAVSLLAWAVLTTLVKPFRLLGPGYLYTKCSVFPTAFSLSLAIGQPQGWLTPGGAVIGLSFLASAVAIVVYYLYTRKRQAEHSAPTPDDLAAITEVLAGLQGDRVLCLPPSHSDYVAYNAGKKVVWGGHSGDLSRLEQLWPVVTRPLEELIDAYRVDYLLLDLAYATPQRLRLDGRLTPVASRGSFTLYRTTPAPR